MRISTKGRYALRLMIDIAINDVDKPVSIKEIARRQDISDKYLEQIISVGALFSGLLVNAGVGLVVLFKVNEHLKENIKITSLLYVIGVVSGLVVECFAKVLLHL